MSATCPDGHASDSTDYCDVCGLPIDGGPAVSAPARPLASRGGAEKQCPNCGGASPEEALFCEDCGRDFVTGALPPPTSSIGGLLSLEPPDSARVPAAPAPTAPAPTAPAPTAPAPTAPAPTAPAAPATPAAPAAPPTIPPPLPTAPLPLDGSDAAPATGWVVEIWVDPDWYASQESDEACPSPRAPVVVHLAHTNLVGRHSASRQITPQVDCGTDSGVSRRHAQLTTDGTRWWVEDLQSANGTYLGKAGGPLPTTPLEAGQRVELEAGDRLYVGAWTRVVVRKALPGE
jgi:hypothetical protein